MNTSAPALPSHADINQAIVNIAAYRFVPLDRLPQRRSELKGLCDSLRLRGTILLSPEGINVFLAGESHEIQGFLDVLGRDPHFAELDVKRSYSDKNPFRRMLVRLKKEIISFGVDSVRPIERTSPKLPARELKQWLDEGRPVRLLDVRNDYEVDLGTFSGAEHLSIGHFREFPQAVERLPEATEPLPIVMFCTGGIRCEKAGPLLEQAGYPQVYQLEGGILKYFEECGGDHYQGSCFVFDGRVALDPQLQPTGNLLCFACQAVLTPEEVTSAGFMFGKYCPHCYVPPEEQRRRAFAQRQRRIDEIAQSQPGCQAYDNLRKIHVPGRLAGMQLLDFLVAYQPAIGREQWRQWIAAGQLLDGDAAATEQTVVREGQCFEHHMPHTTEPAINPHIELLHEDASLVVVNKPAPLPAHPSGRFNRNTLLNLLAPAYPNEKLRVAHRLDANTTGVVVLCRKHQAARFVQPQFSHNQVKKVYLAKVHGHPSWETTSCVAAISAEPTQRGLRTICEQGHEARTDFRLLEKLSDGTSLIEAIPLTGRTNQIRLHLQQLGHEIVGDPLYGQAQQPGSTPTLDVDAPAMCLHASQLSFIHPDTRQLVTFVARQPSWAC